MDKLKQMLSQPKNQQILLVFSLVILIAITFLIYWSQLNRTNTPNNSQSNDSNQDSNNDDNDIDELPVETKYKEYESKTIGFTMKVPEDWSVKEESDDDSGFSSVRFTKEGDTWAFDVYVFYGGHGFCVDGPSDGKLPEFTISNEVLVISGEDESLSICRTGGFIQMLSQIQNPYLNGLEGIEFYAFGIEENDTATVEAIKTAISTVTYEESEQFRITEIKVNEYKVVPTSIDSFATLSDYQNNRYDIANNYILYAQVDLKCGATECKKYNTIPYFEVKLENGEVYSFYGLSDVKIGTAGKTYYAWQSSNNVGSSGTLGSYLLEANPASDFADLSAVVSQSQSVFTDNFVRFYKDTETSDGDDPWEADDYLNFYSLKNGSGDSTPIGGIEITVKDLGGNVLGSAVLDKYGHSLFTIPNRDINESREKKDVVIEIKGSTSKEYELSSVDLMEGAISKSAKNRYTVKLSTWPPLVPTFLITEL